MSSIFQFQNIDICPRAKVLFDELGTPEDQEEARILTLAARHVDLCCGIIKRGYALGHLTEHDHDDFLHNLEEAENNLETLGLLDEHDYLRDDLEARATELLDVSDIDVSVGDDDIQEVSDYLNFR